MEEIIQEGSNVLLFFDKRRSYPVRAEKGKDFHIYKGFVQLGENPKYIPKIGEP